VLADHACSVERWRALALLAGDESHDMSELAEFTQLPPASVTRLVEALVADDLARREADPRDRRRVLVRITRRGLVLQRRLSERVAAEGDTILGDVDEDEVTALLDSVAALRAGLRERLARTPPGWCRPPGRWVSVRHAPPTHRPDRVPRRRRPHLGGGGDGPGGDHTLVRVDLEPVPGHPVRRRAAVAHHRDRRVVRDGAVGHARRAPPGAEHDALADRHPHVHVERLEGHRRPAPGARPLRRDARGDARALALLRRPARRAGLAWPGGHVGPDRRGGAD
jgi:MarR family transcriptional regulator, organic hydroperoxide resistance regulator